MPDTGPDLTGARAAVEALMDDEVDVYRIAPGWAVEDADPLTLELADPAPVTPIYSGPCIISHGNNGYTLKIPLGDGSIRIRKGDRVKPTSSRRDPEMTDRQFYVVEETPVKTFAVSRSYTLEEDPRQLPGLT